MKAILVNADGTTEDISKENPAGLYLIRYEACSECGQPKGDRRKYKCEFATRKGMGSEGTLVYIEEPIDPEPDPFPGRHPFR